MDRINRINRIVVSGLKKEQDGSIRTQKKNNILIFSNPLFEFKDYYPNYSHPFRFFESRCYFLLSCYPCSLVCRASSSFSSAAGNFEPKILKYSRNSSTSSSQAFLSTFSSSCISEEEIFKPFRSKVLGRYPM